MGIIVLLLAIGALSYYYVRHGSLPSMPEFPKQRRLDNDVVEHASPPTAAPTAYEPPSPESVTYSVPDAVASDDVGAWHHYPNTDHVGNNIEHLPQFAGNVLELQRRCRPNPDCTAFNTAGYLKYLTVQRTTKADGIDFYSKIGHWVPGKSHTPAVHVQPSSTDTTPGDGINDVMVSGAEGGHIWEDGSGIQNVMH